MARAATGAPACAFAADENRRDTRLLRASTVLVIGRPKGRPPLGTQSNEDVRRGSNPEKGWDPFNNLKALEMVSSATEILRLRIPGATAAMCADISGSVTQRRDRPFGLRRTFGRPGEFPANRERNREFLDLPAGYMKTSGNLPVIPLCCAKIPHSPANSEAIRPGIPI
jgi:hypothetical protein